MDDLFNFLVKFTYNVATLLEVSVLNTISSKKRLDKHSLKEMLLICPAGFQRALWVGKVRTILRAHDLQGPSYILFMPDQVYLNC